VHQPTEATISLSRQVGLCGLFPSFLVNTEGLWFCARVMALCRYRRPWAWGGTKELLVETHETAAMKNEKQCCGRTLSFVGTCVWMACTRGMKHRIRHATQQHVSNKKQNQILHKIKREQLSGLNKATTANLWEWTESGPEKTLWRLNATVGSRTSTRSSTSYSSHSGTGDEETAR